MNTHTDELDRRLVASIHHESPLGLASGAMGICFYLYRMGRSKGTKMDTQAGKRVLDTIFERIGSIRTIDLETGLSGIGLGVRQLIREGFVNGKTNHVLQDLDDEIFKQLSFAEYRDPISSSALLGIAYYLLQRHEDQLSGGEAQWLYRELIIQILNATAAKIRFEISDAMFGFDTEFLLPRYLYLLGLIRRCGFYNDRTDRLIEEAGITALGTWPISQAGRLTLLWGIRSVLPFTTGSNAWQEHTQLLREHIDLTAITEREITDRSVFIRNGAAGIALLAEGAASSFPEPVMQRFRQSLLHRIEMSCIWGNMLSDPDYFLEHRGLYDGYCGVRLVCEILRSKL